MRSEHRATGNGDGQRAKRRASLSRKAKCQILRSDPSTNVELQPEIEAGRFRQDLFFRLNGFSLTVPPLREHKEDIPPLADHFLRRLATEMGMRAPRMTDEALAALADYDFPGNVRELKNLIERALIEGGGGLIDPGHLHFVYPRGEPDQPPAARSDCRGSSLNPRTHRKPFPDGSDEAQVLSYVRARGSINNSECRELLRVGIQRACYLLRKLHRAGWLVRDHSRKSAQYRLCHPLSGCG